MGYSVDSDPSLEVIFIDLSINYIVPPGKKLVTVKAMYDHCSDMIFSLPNGNNYSMNTGFHLQSEYLPSGAEIGVNFNSRVPTPEFPYYYISGYLINN